MTHLEGVSVGDLQSALDSVEGKRPAKRLLAAIAYKNGVTQTELAEWFGVERKTIYNWLVRLDAGSLEDAATDDRRTGRKRKLSEERLRELERVLCEPPGDAGYDARAWTPALVQTHLRETYDVEYSIPSCRRLMSEAGLRYRRFGRCGADPVDGGEPDEGPKTGRGAWVPE